MFNVCPGCGRYDVEKEIDPAGPFAVCPHCGYRHRFLRLPLFVITGASGAGKSVIGLRLVEALRGQAVVMEGDILWRPELADPENGFRGYHDMWLRVAKNISQSGLPVVFMSTVVPDQHAGQPEARYFSAIHYLGLVAAEDDLVHRLRSRPAWRDSAGGDFIADMVAFNRWLQENAARTDPPMTLLDTSRHDVERCVEQVVAWFDERAS